MTLEISKISNEKLKELANKRDTNKTGKLEESEFILFKLEAEQIKNYGEGVSNQDFKKTLGLYETTPTETTSAEKVEVDKSNWTKKQGRQWDRKKEDIFIRKLNELSAKGLNKTELTEALKTMGYTELVDVTTDLMNKLPDYKSVKDIKENHENIIQQIRKDEVDNELQRNILAALEKNAKNNIEKNVKEQILEMFEAKFRKAAENDMNITQESVMQEIKKELKDDKKFKQEYRDMYKAFENDDVMKNARNNVCNAIYQDLENTKWRKVRHEAKRTLKEAAQWDKYNKKALTGQKFGDTISGQKEYGRIVAENQSIENNVRQSIIQDHKTVQDKLDGKIDVFIALQEAGLVRQTADNKWDLSHLSEIIGTQLGADNRLNRHAKIDHAISEKLRATGKIALDSKLNSLTEKEAKALIKLCGYDIEDKNFGRALLHAAFGLIAGAGAGSGHEIMNPIIDGDTTFENNLNLKITIENGNLGDIAGEFGSGAVIEKTSNSIIIKIHQLIQIPGEVIRLASRITTAGLTSGLVGAALGFLNGMEDKGEIPVSAINFEETDIEKYITRINKENPAYAEALTALAMSFVKDNEWDYQAYKSFLNEAAGHGGKLNKEELVPACKKLLKNEFEEPNKEDVKAFVAEKAAVEANGYEKPIMEEVPVVDGSASKWELITEMYPCLKEKYENVNDRIRILKLTQAIYDGDYSAKRLDELLNLSKTKEGRKKLKEIPGFDYDIFVGVLKAQIIGDVKVPKNLAGCNRDKDEPEKATKVKLGGTGNAGGYAADSVKVGTEWVQTEAAQDAIYALKIDGEKVQTYKSRKERDEAFADYVNNNKAKKVEKIEVTYEEITK